MPDFYAVGQMYDYKLISLQPQLSHSAAVRLLQQAVWQQSLSRASQSMTLSSSQTRQLWRLLTDFRLSRFTALFLQNRQSRQLFRTTTKEEGLTKVGCDEMGDRVCEAL